MIFLYDIFVVFMVQNKLKQAPYFGCGELKKRVEKGA